MARTRSVRVRSAFVLTLALYFPAADLYVRYLEDFAAAHKYLFAMYVSPLFVRARCY